MKRASEGVDEAVRPKPAQMQRCQEEPCTDPVREQLMAGSSGIEKAVLMLMERADASESKLERLEQENQALKAQIPAPLPPGVHIDAAAHFGEAWFPHRSKAVYLELKVLDAAAVHAGQPELIAALNTALADNALASAFAQPLGVKHGTLYWRSDEGRTPMLDTWSVLLMPEVVMNGGAPAPDARAVTLAMHAAVVGALKAALAKVGEEARAQECVEQARMIVNAKHVVAVLGFARAARLMEGSLYGPQEEAPYADPDPGDFGWESMLLAGNVSWQSCTVTAADGVTMPFGANPQDDLGEEPPPYIGEIEPQW